MRITTLLTILTAPLALAACDSDDDTAPMEDMPMAEDQMPMDNADMSMMEEGGVMQTASAEGTVTAIDAGAGTITIEHGPVPAVEWPAMTMGFAADDAQRASVAAGDKVNFTFDKTADGGKIVSITKK